MDKKIISTLNDVAEEFGLIARKVNESSKLRKSHSEEAIKFINLSLEIGDVLTKDLATVAKSNSELRNQDTIVYNTCKVLKANTEKQKTLIEDLNSTGGLTEDQTSAMVEKINALEDTIEKASANIEDIIEKDNIIVYLDNLLLYKKKLQQEAIQKLKKLTEVAFEDAEKAIQGSSSNLERGLELVNKFKSVEKLVEEGKKEELTALSEDANKGWNIAVEVNKSSNSQLEFAEQVNSFTQQLHDDSLSIEQLVIEKHHTFEQNLQTITVLTVLISLKFMKYLEIEDVISRVEQNDATRQIYSDLLAHVSIACSDIRSMAALNYDMTDTSHLNNEIEDKTVKSTKKELEYYGEIKKQVEAMTEATRYPMEGSHRNIENGKKLEETLNEVISSM